MTGTDIVGIVIVVAGLITVLSIVFICLRIDKDGPSP